MYWNRIAEPSSTRPAAHRNKVLMLGARNVYRKVTRKIYDFSPEQEQNLPVTSSDSRLTSTKPRRSWRRQGPEPRTDGRRATTRSCASWTDPVVAGLSTLGTAFNSPSLHHRLMNNPG